MVVQLSAPVRFDQRHARGQYVEALRVFAHCSEVLHSGLGIEPSSQVRAFALRIAA